MNLSDILSVLDAILDWLQTHNLLNALIFLGFVLLSLLAGQYTPRLVNFFVHRFTPQSSQDIYDRWIAPLEQEIRFVGTMVLLDWALAWLSDYRGIQELLKPAFTLLIVMSFAWLISRLLRVFVQVYGISFVQKAGLEPDELILPLEAIANALIGLFAVIIFAQSQNINLVSLVASLGIAATAVGFAAQSALSQLIGTIVLYLDRPFVKGEYIRLPSGLFGRVESIGLRSTKIRTAAKSTLVIVPNSAMANYDIENVTRGKKVMVLLYLDFPQSLPETQKALVEQVIKSSTDALTGIDPGSTQIYFQSENEHSNQRVRITFFILGSTENSLQLRKRMLELANATIAEQLAGHGLKFETKEPTIYVDSPVPL
jgi:small-conductance mechanosensitive channel